MNIAYIHASKYGNGAAVAAEFQARMAAGGVAVEVHHMRELEAADLPPADLYVFSSPGRMGKPRRAMRRFLRKVSLPPGTPFAVLTTEMAPTPDRKTGRMPTDDELARWQRVRPIMNEILVGRGLVHLADDAIHVTAMKGPLEEGWQEKVGAFAGRIAACLEQPAGVGPAIPAR